MSNLNQLNISARLKRAYKETIKSQSFLKLHKNTDPEEKTVEAFKRILENLPHAFDTDYPGDRIILSMINS